MDLIFYTKSGCPLCDKGQAMLDAAGLTYEARDILEDPELYRRYRYRVPVLAEGEREVMEGRFDRDAVARFAKARMGR